MVAITPNYKDSIKYLSEPITPTPDTPQLEEYNQMTISSEKIVHTTPCICLIVCYVLGSLCGMFMTFEIVYNFFLSLINGYDSHDNNSFNLIFLWFIYWNKI